MLKFFNSHLDKVIYALAFSIGLGTFKLSFLLLLFVIILFPRTQYFEVLRGLKVSNWTLIIITIAFLFFYRVGYTPYRPEIFSIEPYYFEKLIILCLAVLMLPLWLRGDEHKSLRLIWYLGLGAFLWAIATIVATVLISNPPYYAKIVDLRALLRGFIQYGNSPGIASLLTFIPVIFLTNFIYPVPNKSNCFWVVFILGSLAALTGAILIEQRSFLLLLYFSNPY